MLGQLMQVLQPLECRSVLLAGLSLMVVPLVSMCFFDDERSLAPSIKVPPLMQAVDTAQQQLHDQQQEHADSQSSDARRQVSTSHNQGSDAHSISDAGDANSQLAAERRLLLSADSKCRDSSSPGSSMHAAASSSNAANDKVGPQQQHLEQQDGKCFEEADVPPAQQTISAQAQLMCRQVNQHSGSHLVHQRRSQCKQDNMELDASCNTCCPKWVCCCCCCCGSKQAPVQFLVPMLITASDFIGSLAAGMRYAFAMCIWAFASKSM